MGQVAISFNVMLESPNTDVQLVESAIRSIVDVQQINVKPVAFGLKILEVLLVFDDKQGANTDAIEEKIRSIDGVSSVETGGVTLI